MGEGGYGEVFKAKVRATGQLVAVKKLLRNHEKEGFPITSIREVKLLRDLTQASSVAIIRTAFAFELLISETEEACGGQPKCHCQAIVPFCNILMLHNNNGDQDGKLDILEGWCLFTQQYRRCMETSFFSVCFLWSFIESGLGPTFVSKCKTDDAKKKGCMTGTRCSRVKCFICLWY